MNSLGEEENGKDIIETKLIDIDLNTTSSRKIAKIHRKHRQQKFRDAWLEHEDYKQWLAKVPEDLYKAKCRPCNVIINAELTVIKNHMSSKYHTNRLIPLVETKVEGELFQNCGSGSYITLQTDTCEVNEYHDSPNPGRINKNKSFKTTSKSNKQALNTELHRNGTDQCVSVNLDECDLYAQLLAKKLRKLDEYQRDVVMNEIDNIVFRARMKNASRKSTSPIPKKINSSVYIVTRPNEIQYENETNPFGDHIQSQSP